ncbi:MAG TPA: DUF1326 domain-containing protein [Isosphaeraceae bacterium]|jgi:hypothetical protein|nr:DUF1326 domain-containing protein [Isosphaeraceae bacterium]
MTRTLAALCGLLTLAAPALAGTPRIQGDYIEARNADIYTGPCFSNAELFIRGNQALLAWKVREGKWDGVDVAGLCVAAAVQADSTFSVDLPEKARAILIVDRRANPEQRKALIALARQLGGARLDHVVAVRTSTMALTVEDHEPATSAEHSAHDDMPTTPMSLFWAPGLAEIRTRSLDHGDHFCGNESVAYEPLSKGVDVQPAYTLGHSFRGEGLDSRWSDPNCRSSFVGRFAL